MKTDGVKIGDSQIGGKDVLALRDFAEGEIVLHWDTSRRLPKEKALKLPDEDMKYVSLYRGEYIVMQSPEKYVNHSCAPNTTVVDSCDVAKRYIKTGEGITGDYSEVLPPGVRQECRCRSVQCRKSIGG
jgi:hypothetical protein